MSFRAFLDPSSLGMGMHVASVRVRRALGRRPRHSGSAEDILRAGLEACWSGRYLTASGGHYRQFWTRDLGFAAPALVRLGEPHAERLLLSLGWAIEVWRARRSHVTTTINPLLRRPVDLFDYGVDSLPLLLAALRSLARAGGELGTRAETLARNHRDWLAGEVDHYVDRVVDGATGLVRADRQFSAHRDTFRNRSTAYANAMVALLARTVGETGWGPDRLSAHFGATGEPPDWGAILRRHFWTGVRFRDRIGSAEASGEANVFPFYAGLVDDREMLDVALATLRREGFASPYPLRFSTRHSTDRVHPVFRLWSADYQTTASWTSLGSIYLALLREVEPDTAGEELARMRELIEREGVLWEVLDERGRPWRSRIGLSVSDHSMLWGAILLETIEHPTGPPLRLG